MNLQCICFARSDSNFCRHSGHWNEPESFTPTFSTLPSPDLASSEISGPDSPMRRGQRPQDVFRIPRKFQIAEPACGCWLYWSSTALQTTSNWPGLGQSLGTVAEY